MAQIKVGSTFLNGKLIASIDDVNTKADKTVFSISDDGLVPKSTISNSTDYLRRDGTWATPPNAVYSEISEAEINTGTEGTLRTITARRITFIINKIKGMLTKADVGLSNVDNTSDVNKPVATTTTNGIMSSTDKISLNANTAVRHSHSNKAVLDKFDESGTQLRYNGEVVVIETVYTWAKLKGSMSWGNFLGQ